MSLLAQLAASAVANNYSANPNRTPIYELSIEDARAKVKVKDGNKKPNEDGSQALVLGFGRKNLPLDIIAPKATRINAAANQVEEYVSILQAAIDGGDFDEVIATAQLEYEEAAKAPKVAPATEEVAETTSVGVDLSELEG